MTYEEERNRYIPLAERIADSKVGKVDHHAPLYKQDEWDVAYLTAMDTLWRYRANPEDQAFWLGWLS